MRTRQPLSSLCLPSPRGSTTTDAAGPGAAVFISSSHYKRADAAFLAGYSPGDQTSYGTLSRPAVVC